MLAALILVGFLMAGLTRTVDNVMDVQNRARASHDAQEESRYALERMVEAVSRSERLLVPQAENPGTTRLESIRDPGVLAVTLNHDRDLDGDGFPDADDDRDGRIDEDVGTDAQNDFAGGIYLLDDDNDGITDPPFTEPSDDESGGWDDDPIGGGDDDGDSAVDEDPPADMNGDFAPGVAGVDDDGDGSIDEGSNADDDEDGNTDEDWWNVVAFYLVGTDLVERIPVPWDETGVGGITGRDFVERTLASKISQFAVERMSAPDGGPPLVVLQLTRIDSAGIPTTLKTTVRVGGGS